MDICDAYSPKTDICPITTPVAHYTLDFRNGTIRAKPIITKADSIRAFTDEELARFIVRKSQCPDGYTSVFGPHCVEENGCEQCWLEWLRQETKEDK